MQRLFVFLLTFLWLRLGVAQQTFRQVHPSNRVAVVCEGCNAPSRPAFASRLTAALAESGYEAVFVDTAKAPGGRPWAAVLDARPGAVQRPGFPPVLPLTPDDPLAMTARLDELLCPKPLAQARILAVFSRQPGISQELISQTLWVARYGRLDIVLLDVFELDRLPYRWLDQYAAVVLAAPSLPIGLAERFAWVLDGYVRRGGAVAALAGMEDQAFWPVFGIGRMDWAEQPFTGIVCDDTFPQAHVRIGTCRGGQEARGRAPRGDPPGPFHQAAGQRGLGDGRHCPHTQGPGGQGLGLRDPVRVVQGGACACPPGPVGLYHRVVMGKR